MITPEYRSQFEKLGVRRVRHMLETNDFVVPVKSSAMEWLAEQERAAEAEERESRSRSAAAAEEAAAAARAASAAAASQASEAREANRIARTAIKIGITLAIVNAALTITLFFIKT